MQTAVSYKKTIRVCYLTHICLAVVNNVTPILFYFLMGLFDLTVSGLGILVLVNFITQVLVNLTFAKVIDRTGFRPLMITAGVFAVSGLLLFSLTQFIFASNIFTGFIIATVIFSVGGGFYQLLLSPIINAIPSDEKSAAMTKLHSFYAWGQILTVLLITLLLYFITSVFSDFHWFLIPVILCLVPLSSLVLFLFVPMPAPVKDKERGDVKKIILNPFFIFAALGILMFGATEIIISQWSSTYIESVMKMEKVLGDILGVCVFAFMIGFGRLLYGKVSKKVNLSKIMMIGAFSAFLLYIIIALSPVKAISIIAFGLAGLAVSLLWPGMLSITSERFSSAGSWMFAVLTAVGNIGSAVGPFLLGQLGQNIPSTQTAQNIASNLSLDPSEIGLRAAVLICSIFPLIAFGITAYLHKSRTKMKMLDKNSLQ